MIQRIDNRIIFGTTLYITDIPGVLACLHSITKAGYQDAVLDFGACTAALPAPILALCSRVSRMRLEGFDFSVVMPDDRPLARHFHNANWAHILEPDRYTASTFTVSTSVFPATQFHDFEGQQRAVNLIVEGILGVTRDLDRKGFAAFEWSVNELTDNVMVHSQSPTGGIIQMSMFRRRTKRIEYIVVDSGIGIPKTLRKAHPDLRSDAEALEQSIREGVTRDKSLGQGNGLYGSYRVCSQGEGIFHLQSGFAKLVFTRGKGLQVSTEKVPFEGTLIDAQVNFSDPDLLSEALNFGGKVHVPTDFVETRYEEEQTEDSRFVMKSETKSFGSRLAGTPIRYKLLNIARMCPSQKIVIDFTEVPLVSSSFADEVFGKLFLEMGPASFIQRFEFSNLPIIIRQLMDKAITQRLSSK